jgi:APA family basic amino acid/polyamine antiporter
MPMSSRQTSAPACHRTLRRELGVFGATMMGLGAMIGTGVFVSIGIAAGVGGPSVVLAIIVAALVAVCNGLSSAQLAASHSVSGGTYEYGYKYLTPALGFAAGWMFLCAKSASAATAALGFAGYFVHVFGLAGRIPVMWLGAGISLAMTGLVLGGMKRSSLANILIVSATLLALGLFVACAVPVAFAAGGENLRPLFPRGDGAGTGFLQACALMFVAYTGYGRIATMGEEVKKPRRIIPTAIIAAMVVAAVIYSAVGIAAIGAYGAHALGEATRSGAAPLETVLEAIGYSDAARLVALGAMTAMLGVLLNLILGLSRVMLAMGRRGDLPGLFAVLNETGTTPTAAVVGVGTVVTALTVIGDVKVTWSFSAFTVLVYYAITNLAALRLPRDDRLYPPFFAWTGLLACLFLAFWVEPHIWLVGLIVLFVGLIWHRLHCSRAVKKNESSR